MERFSLGSGRALWTKLVVGALLLAAGCASLSAKPRVALVDARMVSMRLFETTMLATLRIENESDEPLAIHGGSHRVMLNDLDLGRGLSDEELVIPAYGSVTQEVPLRISNLGLLSQLETLFNSREVHYSIESKFSLDGIPGFRQMTVRNEGDLGLSGLRANDTRDAPRI